MSKVKASNGDVLFVPRIVYRMKDATTCLSSPQTYFQMYGGHATEYGDKFTKHPPRHEPTGVQHHTNFPIDNGVSNIILPGVSYLAEEFAPFGPYIQSAVAEHVLAFTRRSLISS